MENNIVNPLVSVLMPAFNREHYIVASIKSILEQSYDHFELIIIDDGSTDRTLDVIKQFTDPRIRVLQNEKNMGIAFTRNRLLEEAKGTYLMLLDSDDIALPGRMQEQLDFLKANPDALLVGSGVINIDEQDKVLTIKTENTVKEKKPEEIQAMLLFRNCICQSSLMINKQLFQNVRYDLDYPPYEDYELWCRLSKKFKLVNEDKPQVKYRVHTGNISVTTRDKFKMELFNKTTREQFQYYFNYEPTAKELYTHGVWHYPGLHTRYNYLADAAGWLKKISRLNAEKNVFNKALFRDTIKRNWYERCWGLAERGWVFSSFYFLFLNPAFSPADIAVSVRLFFKSVINKIK